MSAKRGLWFVVLTIGFAMVVFGAMTNCAVAGRNAPAVTLPGPDCIGLCGAGGAGRPLWTR